MISLDQILNPPKPLIVKMGIGAVQACVAGNKHGKTALITQCFCLFRAGAFNQHRLLEVILTKYN
jgi:hypothetical protein